MPILPNGVKPEEVMHPTGILYKNPSHIREAEKAANQSEIVKAILGAKRQRITEKLTYKDKPDSQLVLPGVSKIREMGPEATEKLMKALMRFRPNIFKVVISLGNYPSARKIENGKTRAIGSSKPRFHTEVAEEIAVCLSDPSMLVTHVVYTVHNSDPGSFYATGEVYGVPTQEEYLNEDFFEPTVEIEYFPNH
jgi:hypothetical protein